MTIIEAIKSGKAFTRQGYAGWIGPIDPDSDSDWMLEIWVSDILADDWIVREE